jgi:large subunit ribosomal protein L10
MTEVKKAQKIQPRKIDAVKSLVDQFSGSTGYFFADYRGLTVEQITDLRNKLRAQKAEFHVVKNNFARIAFQQLNAKEGVSELLVGPTAVTISHDETGVVAQTLVDFTKESPLQVKGGLVEGLIFNADQVVSFSKLPSKKQLIQMLMGTMNAPMQNFVYALNGITTKLVRTLAAVAEKKGKEG